ncbi:hypothetical protein TWF106_006429 [Orbilia oligospora]|uniref:C2H2-type domain-containing protein n=1 Tax=Orbilia oligospora TaxID=2813651 RepID=A0A7C8QQ93_ORBOL|nr:hypothetical protein TWF106_006429 [Orbilia oligospora]
MDPQEVVELARIRHNFACGMVGLMSKGKSPENVLLDLLISHPIEGSVLDIRQCLNLLSEFKQFALQKYGNSPKNPTRITFQIQKHLPEGTPTINEIQYLANVGQHKSTNAMSPIEKMPFLMGIASVAVNIADRLRSYSVTKFDRHRWIVTYLNFAAVTFGPPTNYQLFHLRPVSNTPKELPQSYACQQALYLNPSTHLQWHANEFNQLGTSAQCVMCGLQLKSRYHLHTHWLSTHGGHPEFQKYWPTICCYCNIAIPYQGYEYHQQFCFGYGGLGLADLFGNSYSSFLNVLFRDDLPPLPPASILEQLECAADIFQKGLGAWSSTFLNDERLLFILGSFNIRMLSGAPADDINSVVYDKVHKQLVHLADYFLNKCSISQRPANISPLAVWTGLPGLVRDLVRRGQLDGPDALVCFQRYKVVLLRNFLVILAPRTVI